jgi:hypothetical protein
MGTQKSKSKADHKPVTHLLGFETNFFHRFSEFAKLNYKGILINDFNKIIRKRVSSRFD